MRFAPLRGGLTACAVGLAASTPAWSAPIGAAASAAEPCIVNRVTTTFLVFGPAREEWLKNAMNREWWEPIALRMASSLGAAGAQTPRYTISGRQYPAPERRPERLVSLPEAPQQYRSPEASVDDLIKRAFLLTCQ